MTTPHEDVTDALTNEFTKQLTEDTVFINDFATTAIETLRKGAEQRLRAEFPTMRPVVIEIVINTILGPPADKH